MYDYDAIVVGSGAAGGLLAYRLTRAGRKVAIIEAGEFYNTNDFTRFELDALRKLWWEYRWTSNYELKGESTNNEIALGMGRCVGGSTTIFDAVAYRVLPENVESWREETGMVNERGEPISYADMTPLYEKIEEEMGVRPYTDWEPGVQMMSEGFSKLGLPLEPTPAFINLDCDRSGCLQGCPTGAKKGSLVTYVIPAVYDGAELITGSFVTEILLSKTDGDEGLTAYGVKFRSRDGVTRTLTSKVVVLCAGALQTPQILLASKVSEKAGHTKSSEQIGRNMAAHTLSVTFGRFDEVLNNWVHHPLSAALMNFAPAAKGGFSFEMSTVNEGPINFAQSLADEEGVPMYGERLKRVTKDYRLMAGILIAVHDANDGRVMLDGEGREKMYKPVTSGDMVRIQKARKLADEGLTVAGARETYNSTLVSHHVQGTCRMGEDKSKSATNSNGELHDVRRLFVCDGSAIPTVLDVNPALTIYALAEKVSQYLLSEECAYLKGYGPTSMQQ